MVYEGNDDWVHDWRERNKAELEKGLQEVLVSRLQIQIDPEDWREAIFPGLLDYIDDFADEEHQRQTQLNAAEAGMYGERS